MFSRRRIDPNPNTKIMKLLRISLVALFASAAGLAYAGEGCGAGCPASKDAKKESKTEKTTEEKKA